MNEHEIVQKENEMAEICKRIDKLSAEDAVIRKDLAKQEARLAEDNKNGRYSPGLEDAIKTSKTEIRNIQSTIGVESNRFAALRKEVMSERVKVVPEEIARINKEYDRNVEDVVKALADLWETSLSMTSQFNKIDKLCADYRLTNPLKFSTLTINNLSLFQTAHYFLRRMEEVFPEVSKKVKHEAYDSRFEVVYRYTK